MEKFTFERATINGKNGYIATRWIDKNGSWIFDGKNFGFTKKTAQDFQD